MTIETIETYITLLRKVFPNCRLHEIGIRNIVLLQVSNSCGQYEEIANCHHGIDNEYPFDRHPSEENVWYTNNIDIAKKIESVIPDYVKIKVNV